MQEDKAPKFVQVSPETYSHLTESEEKVKVLEENVKVLNEQLSAAQSEITTKDALVKQHAKVAEEAVSGVHKLKFTFLFETYLYKLFSCLDLDKIISMHHIWSVSYVS